MSSKLKSPDQSVSIRSPMEKHMVSPTRSTGKRSASTESEADSVSGGNGKISFASPASSRPSRSNTPTKSVSSAATVVSNAKSKQSAQKAAAAAKRKIADLEALEIDQKALLEKLRADSKRTKARLAKMEEEQAKVKFPVKDELLEALITASAEAAATSSKKSATVEMEARKEIPAAVLQLNSMLPEGSVDDAVLVWDFLNVFSKTLSINSISWEDFVELMKHTSRPSVALLDVFCALLKLLLSDNATLTKLNALLPRKVNFAYRQQGDFELNPTGEVDFNMVDLLQQEDFDCEYNGLKLLPRKLKADSVDVLRCQAVLRSVVLRLEPVKQLRKAVLDVTNVAHLSYTTAEPYVEHEELDALVGLASAFKRQRTRTPGQKNASFASAVKSSSSSSSSEPPQTAQKVLSAASMAAINTPKTTKSKQHVAGLDKDAIFQITSDVSAPLKAIYDAAAALETQELHQLRAAHKIVLLKTLCEACYETVRIKQLLARNAEERFVQVQNMNKAMKDQKLKQKEVSGAKRDAAFQACRKINQAAAEAEAARLAELEKKKALSASKKKKKAPATPTPVPEAKGKGKGKGGKGTAAASKAPAKAEVKGPWGGKDGLDPTVEQLYAMIEEMIILGNAGVEVVEEIPMDAPTEEEEDAMGDDNDSDEEVFEYDSRGNLIQRAKRQRRVTSQVRAKTLDRKRNNAERRARQQAVQIAEARLSAALENRSEREMRAAIKYAEKNYCKGYNDEGKAFCTPIMKQVYLKLHEIEVQAKEDRQTLQYERALQEYFVRTTPIGTDRKHNTYWSFVNDDRLFVQTRELLSPEAEAACPRPPSSGRDHDANLTRLFDSRPNRYRYKWSVYSSPSEQWLLWDALDERGERERALKAAIKARFDIEEPQQVYETTGSAYIGMRVKRIFGKKKPVYGLIVGWLPATKTEEALWHVQHLDGDEEDLDEKEVMEYLVQSEEDLAAAAAAQVVDLSGDDSNAGLKKSASSSSLRSTRSAPVEDTIVKETIAKSGSKMVLASDDEAEFDPEVEEAEERAKVEVPRIVQLQSGLYRGTPSWRAPPLSNAIGAVGLRLELTRVMTAMGDELKFRNGQMNRENRKLWDYSVREAQTADDLRAPLLELETLVRNLQTVEDKRDAEEVRLAKEVEKKEMIEEGWIFENDVLGHIGKHARRFFKGFGSSDGVIVAYLPPEKNENVALYHMEHNDGDSEDLELEDLLRAFRYFDQDAQEEEDEDGGESDNEDGDRASDDGDDESEDEDEPEDALHAPGAGTTLWPTYEVRTRWLAALSKATTLGEVALALQAFVEQATAFGMVAPDPFVVEKALAPRSARLAATIAIKDSLKDSYVESSEFARSSRMASSSSNSSSRNRAAKNKAKFSGVPERPSRAAARSVKSYAE